MSRSGYSDDCDGPELVMWRGAVRSATRGMRGQSLLKELLAALDAMTEKRLIPNLLFTGGEVCALGALGRQRSIDMTSFDPEEAKPIAEAFNIAPALAKEIFFMNDEWEYNETPEQRYTRMREWVEKQIIKAKP